MFERVFNFAQAPTQTALVETVNLGLPEGDKELELEAWISNFGGSNVHILEGNLTLTAAQGQLEQGLTSLLMTVSGASNSRIRLPSDVSEITVFFEGTNSAAQYQVVTLRLRERR